MEPVAPASTTDKADDINAFHISEKAISPCWKPSNQSLDAALNHSTSSSFQSIRRLPTPNNRSHDTISLNQLEIDDLTADIASESLYFRPWKKPQDTSFNKWKSRVISDPFARPHRNQCSPTDFLPARKPKLYPLDARTVSESHPLDPFPVPEPLPLDLRPVSEPLPRTVPTRIALADIQRKRHHRRALQAQEKHRIESEILHFGHDTGYKYRRLIQQFLDHLPPSRSNQLPPLSISPNTSGKLSVFLRKRPLTSKERDAKAYDIISCLSSTEIVCHEPLIRVDGTESLKHHSFYFDGIFDATADNDQVYASTVGVFLPKLLASIHTPSTQSLTVFAYGQTGSGKTFTMQSIYRHAAIDLFNALKHSHEKIDVHLSFFEMYQNRINDLLNHRKRVQLLESDGIVQVVGLKTQKIDSLVDLLACISTGETVRSTCANAIHSDSSRSHAILRIILSSSNASTSFSLVDLAGSERASDTQTDAYVISPFTLSSKRAFFRKKTRREGAEINKSLLALKECIRALHRDAQHIPFRQSKLTQLLRDRYTVHLGLRKAFTLVHSL
uniref:Sporangiainduced kinesinlike protein putative n=1 Tax=Albugo laibachii Nc14 TaxID=890382 RepID=F0WAR2_9STRA|nr:sporangiainduced kinesinlike protein putative [Albugo laibachii Nc14]|eukprot:CCA18234.1 sporangiainduced kinesinlike protein putative [Albugo laibachii Nc14]